MLFKYIKDVALLLFIEEKSRILRREKSSRVGDKGS